MSTFHICKGTRPYRGKPYHGREATEAGVIQDITYDTVEQAKTDAHKLHVVNRCGWVVIEVETLQVVYKTIFTRVI